ncbi:DUF4124 domain-containing protein [Iodobacter fluviatilis]|uniref:Uncharacterized protein DUF4124 n=1 Tax=Iodobacter fluviatilis TaxID=537 RepID=A0A377SV39_9NEIS|nr:DUF4124 domain-containing protein [Iodobacter fluviatilis]TCU82059.1 uncharacterized protein DUF4124 [Iodobacter fluviatilis]STR44847.1 Uncharacterised protein [Iodobacter fluviatilis]
MLRGLSTFFILALLTASASAKLYRWVDETGRVQYSDKPPVTTPTSGVTELNKSGIVKTTPAPVLSKEEKDKIQNEQAQQKEQQRKDRALLQSFSKPEEIDLIRDRRIGVVESAIAANAIRMQNATPRKTRIETQIARHKKANRVVPADLAADLVSVQKEVFDIEEDNRNKKKDIENIKAKAEEDKKRLLELKSSK